MIHLGGLWWEGKPPKMPKIPSLVAALDGKHVWCHPIILSSTPPPFSEYFVKNNTASSTHYQCIFITIITPKYLNAICIYLWYLWLLGLWSFDLVCFFSCIFSGCCNNYGTVYNIFILRSARFFWAYFRGGATLC